MRELDEIVKELLSERPERIICNNQLRRWMKSSDIETLGAAFKLLHKPKHYTRIRPPLTFADYHEFHLRYYERCLRENPDGVWCDSRYIAAHSLVAWFIGLWKDDAIPREALAEIKRLLETLYRSGNEELRCAIITGVLEHLFKHRDFVLFFNDWQADVVLKNGFSEARQLTRKVKGA